MILKEIIVFDSEKYGKLVSVKKRSFVYSKTCGLNSNHCIFKTW